MKQWIPYAGLAATIALSGYMVVQLSSDVEVNSGASAPVERHAD